MGGYGALYNGMRYCDTFGAIVALSAALVVDETMPIEVPNPRFPAERNEVKRYLYGQDLEAVAVSTKNPKYMVKELIENKKNIPNIYMACGTEDFLFEKNKDFSAFLKENNVAHEFITGPGDHEWDFWDKYINKALGWLPLEGAVKGRSSGNVGLD